MKSYLYYCINNNSNMKFNKLIPEISVTDFNKTLTFYTKIIGFKIEYQREESKFAMLSFQGSQIMIEGINNNWITGKLDKPFGRGINFQIEVDNVNNILTKLKSNNVTIFSETKENWYRINDKLFGNKEFLVQDPDGYLLRFSEDLGSKPL